MNQVEEEFGTLTELWIRSAWHQGIHNRMTWMGMPVCQLAEDLMMMAELIQKVRPDVIVETGTAHGGTAVFYASMLELLGKGMVISIDANLNNREEIERHPMAFRIWLIKSDSLQAVDEVRSVIGPTHIVLVALDSDHSKRHVLAELEAYSQFVGPGSYIVVFDGVMRILADLPSGSKSWAKDSPAAAIEEFLAIHQEFDPDPHYNRLGITYCPNGFLRRI